MKTGLILALVLALWGGYKFPGTMDDLLTKSISRTDQIVELSIFLFILMIIGLNLIRRAALHRPIFPKLLMRGFSKHILFFYLMALASSVASHYPSYSFFRAGQYLIVIFLVAYLLEEFEDQGDIIKVIFFFSLFNLIYVAASLAFFPYIVKGAGGRLAGGGLFKFDGGIVPYTVSIISLCYFFITKKNQYKISSAIIFVIAGVLLVLYQTRNIIYQAPFYYLFIIYFYRGMSIKSLIIILMILVTMTTIMLFKIELYERLTQRGIKSESRITTWETIIRKRDHIPLHGFGFLGTPSYLLPIKKSLERKGVGITADPHNYFLTAFTEFGVFGLLYAIVFFILLLFLVLKRFKQRALIPQSFLIPGLISIILQSTVSGFVGNFLIASISFKTISVITCLLLLDNSMSMDVHLSPQQRHNSRRY